MKIAVTYDNGSVFQHFGHTEEFKVYTVEDGKVVSRSDLDTSMSGHEALAVVLRQNGVSLLICGGIGQGAVNALNEQGIAIIRGVDMDARMALSAFASQALVDDPSKKCTHHAHEEGHSCADHSCQK